MIVEDNSSYAMKLFHYDCLSISRIMSDFTENEYSSSEKSVWHPTLKLNL